MNVGSRLSDGQLVTLLVGVGLDLLPLHRTGHAYGPIHPAHVTVDAVGHPRLADVAPPAAWTPHDDWVALIRFGRFVGDSPRAGTLSWAGVTAAAEAAEADHEGIAVLRWLMGWATPEPLPPHIGHWCLPRSRLPKVA
jgi:hypothetical protein